MMLCFRVYTENINQHVIIKEANKRFPGGFSFFTGQGYWEGNSEPCCIIEIIRAEGAEATIERFAEDIKRLNKQDSVYVTSTELSSAILV